MFLSILIDKNCWLGTVIFCSTNYGKHYDYSPKNIQTLTKTSYQLSLIEKIESVIKRMRWEA